MLKVNNFLIFILSTAIGLLFSLTASAESSVWRISKDSRELYLGGTIHVLSEDNYPLPCEFNFAYNRSSLVYFETDINAIQSGTMARQLALDFVYTDGKNLGDFLKPTTYQLLQSFASKRNLNTSELLLLKPGALMASLLGNELVRAGITAQGVDAFYNRKSLTDGKKVGWFEAPQQHMDFIIGLGQGNEDQFVRYLINDLEKLSLQIEGMIATWRKGDLEALEQVANITRLKRLFPQIYKTLLTERNKRWLPMIEELLATGETELVLVGALHLPGSEGLLNLLKLQGYQLEKLNACQS